MILSPAEALAKREELFQRGYTSIPKVMPAKLVEELRAWSDGIFARTHVRYEIRYQGSDLFVYTERGWSTMAPEQRQRVADDPRRFPDPMATRTIDLPAQLAVCREIGLENLHSDEVLIILSKPAHGPPLYWHQDFMQWDSPRAATPWSTRRGKTAVCASSPGSHRTRHGLHDILPDAHGEELQALEDLSHPAFADNPDAVDVLLGGRRPADRRRPPAACGVAQPERPAPHPAAGLARRVLVPGAAKLVDRGDPRRRQKRRSHGAVRSHQDPQSLHRLTARVCRSAGLPILARLPSTVFVCNTMYSTSVAYNSWRSGCQEQ